MRSTYKRLLGKLHKKYPGKHISISAAYAYYDHTDQYETQYYVYVEDTNGKYIPTFSEVRKYVQHLCGKEG